MDRRRPMDAVKLLQQLHCCDFDHALDHRYQADAWQQMETRRLKRARPGQYRRSIIIDRKQSAKFPSGKIR